MKEKSWTIEYHIPDPPEELLAAGYPPLLARVLTLRGITTAAEADAFIRGSNDSLHDPMRMKGMQKAVKRIRKAIDARETIAVYGDYDVDGITATCLLSDYLTSKGATCIPYIPDRIGEGYGLNCEAIERFSEQGVTLVITVDCGITGVSESSFAAERGIDMIITDHHECKDNELPNALAVIDPKQAEETYPNADLAGVGVAFKLVCACEGSTEDMLDRYADLAAIGTVADVMPLVGENRTLVRLGLEKLRTSPRPGIAAMLREAGAEAKSLTASSIGYVLAPRLNAAGRMDKAMRAADLLMSTDGKEAAKWAAYLCDLNRKRQETENRIWKEAVQLVGRQEEKVPIVLANTGWDQGVIGIAASRIAEQYGVPTIMICLNGDVGKGSCRSYNDFNLYDALSACSEHLISFGGHALAAGLNIEKEKIDGFRQALAAYYRQNRPEETCEVNCELLITDPAILDVSNVRSLDLLEPYGNCNTKPVMCLMDVRVESFSNVGNGKHLKMRIDAGSSVFDSIFFSHTSQEFHLRTGDRIDVAFTPQINEFRGVTSVQLLLCGLRRHDGTALCEDILETGCTCFRAASQFCPERGDFVQVWKSLGKGFSLGQDAASVLRACPSGLDPETYCLCLSVFREAGLLSSNGRSLYGAKTESPSEKADLEATPLLRLLRSCQNRV